ncbi:hypothetical protein HNQ92_000605 [Rhabdobacter roseus]|uniref:Uncharacterized protein n=1 Tax=Rhabdobacter roseus TaxID=1655419 RepID=A0A840TG79_9BACT|nr:hypothetical protein [Rhabdobacter roseus]
MKGQKYGFQQYERNNPYKSFCEGIALSARLPTAPK